MNIACLGWGSLIWDPRGLPMRGKWFEDGPLLPIEFSRIAQNERVTLVITEDVPLVRSLWVLLSVTTLEDAVRELADREGISPTRREDWVGTWQKSIDPQRPPHVHRIANWAEQRGLDAVVWTNLPCGPKENRGQQLSYQQVRGHLETLPPDQLRVAENYIRRAPEQIDTDYRRSLQRDLGWMRILG